VRKGNVHDQKGGLSSGIKASGVCDERRTSKVLKPSRDKDVTRERGDGWNDSKLILKGKKEKNKKFGAKNVRGAVTLANIGRETPQEVGSTKRHLGKSKAMLQTFPHMRKSNMAGLGRLGGGGRAGRKRK